MATPETTEPEAPVADQPETTAPAEQTKRTMGRDTVLVEYQEGHSERLFVDNPQVVFQANQLKIDDDTDRGFVVLWLAAGKPGLDTATLTKDTALRLTGEWLGTVKVIHEREDGDAAVPPTDQGATP